MLEKNTPPCSITSIHVLVFLLLASLSKIGMKRFDQVTKESKSVFTTEN